MNVLIINPYKKTLNLICALKEEIITSLSRSFSLQNRFGSAQGVVGGKYGRTKDAAFFFLVQCKITV